MEKRKYGNTDMQVSVLGFGGSEIGGLGAPDAHSQGVDKEQVEKILGSALDAGLNVIDTAECYNDSEEKIGAAVAHRRDEYYLFTKCGHGKGFDLPHWDPKMLEMSIDRSLRRLKTDYIDMIHLHTCTAEVLQKGDVIEVLQRAKEKGKIRYFGYSGDHKDALYAVNLGVFDSLMTSLNLMDQEAIELTLPEAQKQGMGVVVKRPIANVVWRYNQLPPNQYHHAYWERSKQLDYDFLKGENKEAVGKALRFTLPVPGVHTAIVGTMNPTRWVENAKLLEDGSLPPDQYGAIRARWKSIAPADWMGLE
jgi:aryl-alcohol dehydrogenase-like predicted oxidoreductase